MVANVVHHSCSLPYIVIVIGQISMNVRVGLLSVTRMHSVTTLMVAFTVTAMWDTQEVVILVTAMVHESN